MTTFRKVFKDHLGEHYKVYMDSIYLGNIIDDGEDIWVDFVKAPDDSYEYVMWELIDSIVLFKRQRQENKDVQTIVGQNTSLS